MQAILIDSSGQHVSGPLKATLLKDVVEIHVQTDSTLYSVNSILFQKDDGSGAKEFPIERYLNVSNGDMLRIKAKPQLLSHLLLGKPLSDEQKRVLDEKQDLDIRITRLDEFIRGDVFNTLSTDEKARLRRQLDVMHELSVILGERVSAF